MFDSILCPIIGVIQGVVDTVLGLVNNILGSEITLDIADLLGLTCETEA
jgi:hypothetical protein